MKNFIKVTLKNGQILDMVGDYSSFVKFFGDAEQKMREEKMETIFSDDLMTFKFSDIELIQSANQEDGTEEITRETMNSNIVRMEEDIMKFKRFRDSMTTDSVLVSDLIATMEKPDFSALANETIETGAEEIQPNPSTIPNSGDIPVSDTLVVMQPTPDEIYADEPNGGQATVNAITGEQLSPEVAENAYINPETGLIDNEPTPVLVPTPVVSGSIADFIAANPVEQPEADEETPEEKAMYEAQDNEERYMESTIE